MKTKFHVEVAGSESWRVLGYIRELPFLKKFYLAGGTGLALQLGHRRSRDFDFFNAELFDENILIQDMRGGLKSFVVESKAKHTLNITADGAKFTFLGYNYPLLFPFIDYAEDGRAPFHVADA